MRNALYAETPLRDDRMLGKLRSFVRNRYFYGKLLDVHHLVMEQRYLNEKRWLLNRLGLGSGVLCGLKVEALENGSVVIRPGVALDGFGREVIVPEPFVLEDPLALTDDCGRATGEHADTVATICLAYHECGTEPTPVLVSDCDVREECQPGAIRERFRVLVHDGLPDFDSPVDCSALGGSDSPTSGVRPEVAVAGRAHAVAAERPQPVAGERPQRHISDSERARLAERMDSMVGREAEPTRGDSPVQVYRLLCEAIDHTCAPPEQICVPIAAIAAREDGDPGQLEIYDCGFHIPIYSNAVLLDLMICLARTVGRGQGRVVLRYEEGDTQTAAPDSTVTVAATALAPDGDALTNHTVTFRGLAGGGAVGDGTAFTGEYQVTTDGNGRAEATWQLGSTPGLNTLEATESGGARVVFHALAETGG